LALHAATLVKIFYEQNSWKSLSYSLPETIRNFLSISEKPTINPSIKYIFGNKTETKPNILSAGGNTDYKCFEMILNFLIV